MCVKVKNRVKLEKKDCWIDLATGEDVIEVVREGSEAKYLVDKDYLVRLQHQLKGVKKESKCVNHYCCKGNKVDETDK